MTSPGVGAAIMAEVASGILDVPAGTRRLEAVRWLHRVTYHVWRMCEHLPSLQCRSGAPPSGAAQGSASAG